MSSDARFRPQARLAEVGQLGMQKILAAHFRVQEQPGGWVEQAYLERAGGAVESVRGQGTTTPPQEPEFAHRKAFHYAAAEEIAGGSWRALRQLRQTLGILP